MSRPGHGLAVRRHGPSFCAFLLGAAACWLALYLTDNGRAAFHDRAAPHRPACTQQRPRRRPPSGHADSRPAHLRSQGLHLVSNVHAIEVANLAASSGEHEEWATLLRLYLDPANATALHLRGGPGPLLGRLATRPFPAVPGGPVVSVIMVASNAQDTIGYAARSILEQTWTALELIIVDDASTDGTWAVADALSKSDARVKLLRNPVRVGPYVSRNRALVTAVAGEYVTTQDADDWALPRRLEVQVQTLADSGGAIRGNYVYSMRVQESGVVSTVAPGPAAPDGVSRQACPSAMYETALLRDHLGHWDSVLYEADNEMMFRARTFLGAGFVEIPHVGVLQADRPRSLGKQGYKAKKQPPSNSSSTSSSSSGEPVSNRAQYRQAYSAWHKQAMRPGHALYLGFPLVDRPFPAPEDMVIKLASVCACLEGSQHACVTAP
jgi:hypothetical protein